MSCLCHLTDPSAAVSIPNALGFYRTRCSMAPGNFAPAIAAVSIAIAAALLLRNAFIHDPLAVERALKMDFATPPPWPIYSAVNHVSAFLSRVGLWIMLRCGISTVGSNGFVVGFY